MNEKLIKAYKDVFGSAGPATDRTDEEIEEILTNNKVRTEDGARVVARKELSGQLDPDAKIEESQRLDEEAEENRKNNE